MNIYDGGLCTTVHEISFLQFFLSLSVYLTHTQMPNTFGGFFFWNYSFVE